jgi:beta-lactamase regulating signal transducer with metallopeptidase domain
MSTLTPLFEASLRGALLIGILALLRVPIRRLIGSPWLCSLWLVVLIRLLLPGSVQSSWSVFNWWPQAKTVEPQRDRIETRVTLLPTGAGGATVTTASLPPATFTPPANNGVWLATAWAAGAAMMLAMFAWRTFKTFRMVRFTTPPDNAELLEAFESIPREIRGNVGLRQVSRIDVPALVGLWRPQIWMPTSWLRSMNVEEIRHVLLHEIGHARRGDLWVQWLFAIVQCVHWFNPAVWIAARLAHSDRELACDAWVLRRADLREPEQYGQTLIKAAQLLRSRWHLPPAAITMAMSKAGLFSRVRSIGQFHPVASWRSAFGFIGVGLMLASVATDRLHAQSGGLPPSVDPAPSAGGPPAGAPGADNAFGAGFGASPQEAGTASVGAGFAQTAPTPVAGQVEVAAKFLEVELPEEGWKELGLGKMEENGMLQLNGVLESNGADAFVQKFIDAKFGVTLLSAPRVTTRSGQRAVIEIIREVRYATTFQPDAKHPDGLVPTSFETRNVGVTLETEPVIAADGKTVDLTLIPQVVELSGYTRVRDGQSFELSPDVTKRGLERTLDMSLPKDVQVIPIFSTRKITTSVSLLSGNTVFLGGLRQPQGTEKGKNARVLFIFITAKIRSNPVAQVAAGAGLEPLPPAATSAPALEPLDPNLGRPFGTSPGGQTTRGAGAGMTPGGAPSATGLPGATSGEPFGAAGGGLYGVPGGQVIVGSGTIKVQPGSATPPRAGGVSGSGNYALPAQPIPAPEVGAAPPATVPRRTPGLPGASNPPRPTPSRPQQ